jgi:hypothetical protein
MVELPSDLSAWTYDTILEIVQQHEYEPGYFDYKLALNATNPDSKKREDHLASIRRTVCAMANSGGGFLLFGIRDRNQNVANPEDRIAGIPVGGDLLRDFGHKVADLQPPIFFEATPQPLLLPQDASKGIFVVRIPESQRRPHLVRTTGAFYRRGDGGTAEIMDFYQIRDLMLMRRQAHLENLKWEIEENIAAICRKHQDLPSPAHSWLHSVRNSVKLTDSGIFHLSEKETLRVSMFWALSPNPSRLRTAALQEAIHSGEFLVFRQDVGRLTGGRVYQVMQALNTAMDEYRATYEAIAKRSEEMGRIIGSVKQKSKSTPIEQFDLMMLYILHDRQQDALRLAVVLLQHILDPTTEVRMPDLNPISPLEDYVDRMIEERTTPDDVERWVKNGYFAYLLTGENKATTTDMGTAIETSPAMQQGLVEPITALIAEHTEEFRRLLLSEGQDGAVAWVQAMLKDRNNE